MLLSWSCCHCGVENRSLEQALVKWIIKREFGGWCFFPLKIIITEALIWRGHCRWCSKSRGRITNATETYKRCWCTEGSGWESNFVGFCNWSVPTLRGGREKRGLARNARQNGQTTWRICHSPLLLFLSHSSRKIPLFLSEKERCSPSAQRMAKLTECSFSYFGPT